MFSRLPESNATRQRRLGGAIVSTAVHLVFIALAVRATGLKAAPAPKTGPLPPPIFVEPPPPSTDPVARRGGAPTSPASPMVPLPPSPTLPNVDVIKPIIPEPGTPIDPTAWGNPRATGISSSERGSGSPNVSDGSPLPDSLVDNP